MERIHLHFKGLLCFFFFFPAAKRKKVEGNLLTY